MSDEDLYAEYRAALHAMQTGVACKMNYDASDTSAKHLRVGINSAMCEHRAIVELLLAKGIITEEEYADAITKALKDEVAQYEAWLENRLGKPVTLA